MRRFARVATEAGPRVAVVGEDAYAVLDHDDPLAAIRGEGATTTEIPKAAARLLPPIVAPEIWGAGVTYERSRDARLDESRTAARDSYSLVYEAERPELFFKDAAMRRTVGPGEPIRTRADSRWTVPEPELALVLGDDCAAVAVTVANDLSSRDIEGENPLYIPQAKIFAGACAIGPVLAVPDDWARTFSIRLRIFDAGGIELFSGETGTGAMHRSFSELTQWLARDNPIPAGSLLMTGTGLVPPDDYTLEPGHVVEIEVRGVGTLRNPVTA